MDWGFPHQTPFQQNANRMANVTACYHVLRSRCATIKTLVGSAGRRGPISPQDLNGVRKFNLRHFYLVCFEYIFCEENVIITWYVNTPWCDVLINKVFSTLPTTRARKTTSKDVFPPGGIICRETRREKEI